MRATAASSVSMSAMKRTLALMVVAACLLVAAPTAFSWHPPTAVERSAIVAALPPYYHQTCIRYTIRISTVDRRFAAVFFRFVAPNRKGCSPFDGQVLMKRTTATATKWKKVGEGSEWPCHESGVATRVVKDLFGGCGP